jgi:hypothetical protein
VTGALPFLSMIGSRRSDVRFILERDVEAHAVALHGAVLDRDVETLSLGATQVTGLL